MCGRILITAAKCGYPRTILRLIYADSTHQESGRERAFGMLMINCCVLVSVSRDRPTDRWILCCCCSVIREMRATRNVRACPAIKKGLYFRVRDAQHVSIDNGCIRSRAFIKPNVSVCSVWQPANTITCCVSVARCVCCVSRSRTSLGRLAFIWRCALDVCH